MPHQSFGTVRTGVERDPITFDFGVFGEETFTVIPTPMLGDTLDLLEAPEPTPDNELESVAILVRFIRRLLAPEDLPRFNQALYRIPVTEAHIIIQAAAYISEQVTTFPTVPPTTSSRGRQPTGTSSKRKPGGTGRSRK